MNYKFLVVLVATLLLIGMIGIASAAETKTALSAAKSVASSVANDYSGKISDKPYTIALDTKESVDKLYLEVGTDKLSILETSYDVKNMSRKGQYNIRIKSMVYNEKTGALITYINAEVDGKPLHIHNPIHWYMPFSNTPNETEFNSLVIAYLTDVPFGDPVNDDTLVIYPTVDGAAGYLYNDGLDYFTLRGVGGNEASSSSTQVSAPYLLADAATNKFEDMWRGILSFDTSPLNDFGNITSAKLRLSVNYVKADLGTNNISIFGGTLASNTAIASGDYDGEGTTPFSGFSAITATGDANFTLNAAGKSAINKLGYTVIYLRDNWDYTGAGPSWVSLKQNYIQWVTVEGSAGSRPYLEVIFDPVNANFTGTPTTGSVPLTVSFFDNTTGFTPTAWNWSFGDGNYSNDQNPSHSYYSVQLYSVSLIATNSSGSGNLTRTNYINVTLPGPTANFAANVTTGMAPLAVKFNDSSTGSPTSWNYSLSGSYSNLQNPTATYSAGTYTISLDAGNAYGNNTLTRTNYITAIATPNSTGYYISGLIRDSITYGALGSITVTLTNASSSWTSTTTSSATGTFFFVNLTNGTYGASINDLRYNPWSQAGIVINGANPATLDILLNTTSTVPGSIQYYPHMVSFICKDQLGNPLSGVSVTAQGYDATAPQAWIKELIGIDLQRVPLANQSMVGITGSDGGINFLMVETVQYDLTFAKSSIGVSQTLTLYPKEDRYTIPLETTATAGMFGPGSTQITKQLSHGQNSSALIFRLFYNDSSLTTTNVTFWVGDINRSLIWSQDYAGGFVNVTHVITPYTHGQPYTYGYNAYNPTYGTNGWISGTGALTTRSRLINIPGLPDSWYTWITVILLVTFVAMFSGITNRLGSLFFGMFVLFYWWIGWIDWFPSVLDDNGLGFALAIAIIGALVYISRTYSSTSMSGE